MPWRSQPATDNFQHSSRQSRLVAGSSNSSRRGMAQARVIAHCDPLAGGLDKAPNRTQSEHTMIGLYFLTVIGIYALIWCWIVWWCKPRWAKWVLVLVAVVIPTWDLVPQHIAYRAACATEAGEYVASERIEVAGFFDAELSEEFARSFVEELGFKYIETYTIRATGKTLIRVERDADGAVKTVDIARPTSRYEVSSFNYLRADRLRAFGKRVIDRETGNVVASQATIAKARSWLFRALFPSSWPGGGGAACSGESYRYPGLVPGFLVPQNNDTDTDKTP